MSYVQLCFGSKVMFLVQKLTQFSCVSVITAQVNVCRNLRFLRFYSIFQYCWLQIPLLCQMCRVFFWIFMITAQVNLCKKRRLKVFPVLPACDNFYQFLAITWWTWCALSSLLAQCYWLFNHRYLARCYNVMASSLLCLMRAVFKVWQSRPKIKK